MQEMKDLMQLDISCGDTVSIVLKNGQEVTGQVEAMGNDLFRLIDAEGNGRPLAYGVVGTYTIVSYAAPDHGMELAAVPLEQLQRELKESEPELYRQLLSKLNSLNNAIRIREVQAKYGRTPGVLLEMMDEADERGGSEPLLALIGEVALLTDDTDYCLDALDCYIDNWEDRFWSSDNLLRLAVRLSLRAQQYDLLKSLLEDCPPEGCARACRALLYLLKQRQLPVDFPLRSVMDQPQTLQRLLKRLSGGEETPAPKPEEKTLVLGPLQAVGTIFFYNPQQRYGQITGEDGVLYRFTLNNVDTDIRDQLDRDRERFYGRKVLFRKTMVYSPKQHGNVPSADRIELLGENVKLQRGEPMPQEAREEGVIVLYMQHRGVGYICRAEDYVPRAGAKGNVFFESKDVLGSAFLDTRTYYYKVTFAYADPEDNPSTPRRAKNIQILEAIPIPGDSGPVHAGSGFKPEDMEKYSFLPGETLLVRDAGDNLYLGDYLGRSDTALQLYAQGQEQTVEYSQIKALLLFGLITSYNLLNGNGMINGIYPFRSNNVVSTELSHLLRQNKYPTFLCMYSLQVADNHLYVDQVDYLSDTLSKLLPWRTGAIRGEYRVKDYLSVETTNRCYISSIKDSHLLSHFNPPAVMSFLEQEVFYKVVNHKTPGAEDTLSQSAWDVRLRHLQGKVNFHALNPGSRKIQSGSYSYLCEQDLSGCANGALVRLRLKLAENNELVADSFEPVDLARELEGPDPLRSYEDDVFDTDLQLNNMKVMTLLEFTRDAFDIGRIRAYLPAEQQRMLQDGCFSGTAEEGHALVQLLSEYKSARRGQKREPWVEKIPVQLRPELLLAAAQLNHRLRLQTGDSSFTEEAGTKILVNYAWQHLTTGLVTEPAEVEYFSEIIFLNDFPDKTKHQMQARCLAEYFVGMKNVNLSSFGDRMSILGVLRRDCTDIPGLTKMLMNLPAEPFRLLLECAESLKGQQLLQAIAEAVSGGAPEEGCAETVRTYYQEYARRKALFIQDISGQVAINDVPVLLNRIEEAEQGIGRYLFDEDRNKLERIRRIVNGIADTLTNENVVAHTTQLENAFGQLRNVVADIEAHPSRFTFEVLRTFARSLQDTLVQHLNQQYLLNRPQLKVEHYSLSGDARRETFCVSNEGNCLIAHNVRVSAAVPYGEDPGFRVELEGNRQIIGEGKSVASGKGIEISVPIEVAPGQHRESLALTVRISYECNAVFNPELSIAETRQEYLPEVNLQIPLTASYDAPLTRDDNPYRAYAGGKDMKPDGKTDKMFFGRKEDIETVFQMLLDDSGSLCGGTIVAIYGQKRCGKTSVMNFLGKRIREQFPDALVLSVNAQNVDSESAYKSLLSEICMEFRNCRRRNPQLKADLKEAGLEVPSAASVFDVGGEAGFHAFFREFRAEFGEQYPIVLMVDEFTQAYVLMKKGQLSGDFLNRWRAMVQSNAFVNVVVGQDFMEKFTTDEAITRLNYGGAVNGLGTMGRKRLSYLDFESAREMMVEPIRKPDGTSRYQDILGEEAIKRIYELTGGSAFYLMKFCNALVNYMTETNEQLVYTSLVETVADGYVFDNRDNPVTKTDFDPIYNAYSYDAESEATTGENMDDQAQQEMEKSYRMLKQIADNSNRLGVCNTSSISWADPAEKNRILQTLRVRGVLCDPTGAEIKSENMENINVKIKVGLFSIWLKKRG